jgi:cytochrome c oxidase subunit 2
MKKTYTLIVSGLLMLCVLTLPLFSSLAQSSEKVIKVQAKRFSFQPSEIVLKKGVPVVLELTSLDVHHGFNCPDLKLHADIFPEQTTTLRVIPDKIGTFPFYCDFYCGEGHEDMAGSIIVTE